MGLFFSKAVDNGIPVLASAAGGVTSEWRGLRGALVPGCGASAVSDTRAESDSGVRRKSTEHGARSTEHGGGAVAEKAAEARGCGPVSRKKQEVYAIPRVRWPARGGSQRNYPEPRSLSGCHARHIPAIHNANTRAATHRTVSGAATQTDMATQPHIHSPAQDAQ